MQRIGSMSHGNTEDWEGETGELFQVAVIAIRRCYPSPNGVYTGYRPARL